MDHSEVQVLLDRDQANTQRIKSRSHHKHQGKSDDHSAFFADIVKALAGSREVLLCGPIACNQFSEWCSRHAASAAAVIVDSIVADHPTDVQLAAMARRYFKHFDSMASDPSLA